ncbi:MAG: hypothetical protein EZS28_046926, partial [Streblomastix strix]
GLGEGLSEYVEKGALFVVDILKDEDEDEDDEKDKEEEEKENSDDSSSDIDDFFTNNKIKKAGFIGSVFSKNKEKDKEKEKQRLQKLKLEKEKQIMKEATSNLGKSFALFNQLRMKRSNLAITGGLAGARLTHSHRTQVRYVRQTLVLWREIMTDFYKLWMSAEQDLLMPNNGYRFRDTGQGANRMQDSPVVSRSMHEVLNRVQNALQRRYGEQWVGLAVVHLADTNVPNSFVFIDKYTQ